MSQSAFIGKIFVSLQDSPMMPFSRPHIMSHDHRTPAAQSGHRTAGEDAVSDVPDKHSASADDATRSRRAVPVQPRTLMTQGQGLKMRNSYGGWSCLIKSLLKEAEELKGCVLQMFKVKKKETFRTTALDIFLTATSWFWLKTRKEP